MIRHCDGSDPNLTRVIPAAEYNPAEHIVSPWQVTARTGEVIINCDCRRMFNDIDYQTVYPHNPVGGWLLRAVLS